MRPNVPPRASDLGRVSSKGETLVDLHLKTPFGELSVQEGKNEDLGKKTTPKRVLPLRHERNKRIGQWTIEP